MLGLYFLHSFGTTIIIGFPRKDLQLSNMRKRVAQRFYAASVGTYCVVYVTLAMIQKTFRNEMP